MKLFWCARVLVQCRDTTSCFCQDETLVLVVGLVLAFLVSVLSPGHLLLSGFPNPSCSSGSLAWSLEANQRPPPTTLLRLLPLPLRMPGSLASSLPQSAGLLQLQPRQLDAWTQQPIHPPVFQSTLRSPRRCRPIPWFYIWPAPGCQTDWVPGSQSRRPNLQVSSLRARCL